MAANLLRTPIRTVLAFVALVVAFLLFVLLRSISTVFAADADMFDSRLLVTAKYRSAYMLPISQVEQIRSVEHVVAVSPMVQLFAFFQHPKQSFTQFAVFPSDYLRLNDEMTLAPEVLERLESVRTGAVISDSLVDEYGWKPGDRVPLVSPVYIKKDGSRVWEVEIVGAFSHVEDPVPPTLLLNYDYYAEATLYNQNVVGSIAVGVDAPAHVVDTMQAIDALFADSPQPTTTQTFDYLSRNAGRQIGDIGYIASFIMAAVFFTVMLVVGSVMAQSIRERRCEHVVMKCLGFQDWTLALLVVGETVLLCFTAAVVGILLSLPLEHLFDRSLSEHVGHFSVTWQSVVMALLVALGGGVLIGIVPAYGVSRTVVGADPRRP